MKLYYQLWPTGKIRGVNEIPQTDVEQYFLEEAPGDTLYKRDGVPGENWIPDQEAIDAEIAYEQKHIDATEQLTLNDLANKTYTQAETYIDNNVTDLASQVAFDKKLAKIVLAMLKRMDLSE